MDLDPISFAYSNAIIDRKSFGFYRAKCDNHLRKLYLINIPQKTDV